MFWILFSFLMAIIAIVVFRNIVGSAKSKAPIPSAVLIIPIFIWALVTFIWGYTNLDNRTVLVVSTFGSIDLQHPVTSAGFHFIWPYHSKEKMEIQGDEIDLDPELLSTSNDGVGLGMKVSLPYALNPGYAPYVLARLGDKDVFKARLQSSAQTALKNTAATMPWRDIVINQRSLFEQNLHAEVEKVVATQLEGLGFTEIEAKNAFTFLPLQVSTITLPDRVNQQNAENAAAIGELQRQITLTQQSAEIAKRRELEGTGIKMMLAELPLSDGSLTPHGIAEIITAQAFENQSLSVKTAVESGKVGQLTIIVSPSGNPPNTAVK